MPVTTESSLTPAEKRRLTRQQAVGSAFDPFERVFGAFDQGTVFDYGEFSALDIATMLKRDGKARATFEVLTLPLRGAKWRIDPDTGDNGQAALVRDNLGERLGTIIDQCTTAFAYKRSFFELTWRLDGPRVVYDEIALRPPTGCEAGFDPKTGKPQGFRQRIVPVAGILPTNYSMHVPGYVVVKPQRAFIYTHGVYREPIKGVSDLDVAYWSFETKQKIMFLLFQFLENQSLPKTVVYGDDIDQATELATDVAGLKSAGVLGLPRPAEPTAKAFEVLESAGQGATQFMETIKYLDTMMVASVLAGFTELADNSTASRMGSYALSADQSEFFLASRQAVADEISDAIREGLFKPLIVNNYGPDAPVPKLTIGPLSNRSTERALALLTGIIAAPQLNVPAEFVDQLTQTVADYLGLDAGKVRTAIAEHARARAQQDQLKLAAQKQLLAKPNPTAGRPPAGEDATSTAGASAPTPPNSAAPPNSARTPRPPTVRAVKTPSMGQGVAKLAAPAGDAVELSAAVELSEALVRARNTGHDPAVLLAQLLDPPHQEP